MRCVILMNLGGPDSLASVEPFLANLFSDPDIFSFPLGPIRRPLARWIAKNRTRKVLGLYEKIGGKSPLREITLQQAAMLEKLLADGDQGDPPYRVFVAMRYWHPLTEETVRSVLDCKPDHVILLPLYPQYSRTTTGSSFHEFDRIWAGRGDAPQGPPFAIHRITHYFDHPGYLEALAETIREGLQAVSGESSDPIHLVFSAHGVPERVIRGGDLYQEHVEKTVSGVLSQLNWTGPAHLCYQSRVGPLRWIGPSTEETLQRLSRDGVRRLLMVPVTFVSDHLETLYEIDLLFRDRALELGISHFHRSPALNLSVRFMEALRDLVLAVDRPGATDSRRYLS